MPQDFWTGPENSGGAAKLVSGISTDLWGVLESLSLGSQGSVCANSEQLGEEERFSILLNCGCPLPIATKLKELHKIQKGEKTQISVTILYYWF